MTTVRRTDFRTQQQIAIRREQAAKEHRESIQKGIEKDRAWNTGLKSEERTEDLRLLRQLAAVQKEVEEQANLNRVAEQRRLLEEQRVQEERMARELERIKHEEVRDDKLRQLLRETAPEIRELEVKLRAAYVNKERMAQIAERDAHKFDEMIQDAELVKHAKDEAERARRVEETKAIERARQREVYKSDLEEQLVEQERARQAAYEEFLKEKLMVDEVVRKLYEEDQRERELEMRKVQATREFIEEFKKEREEWKYREKQQMEAENRRILEFMKLQKVRTEKQAAEKKEREEAKSKVQERVAAEMLEKEKERLELEQIRQELYLEEQQERDRQRMLAELERRIRQRIELQREYELDSRIREQRLRKEREEEEKIRQMMLAKFAADDRIEQLTKEKRRQKMIEHKHAAEKLLEERRARLEAERAAEVAAMNEERSREELKLKIIEEERQRLLREHATKLLGYLPKGVLRDQADVELLGAEFQRQYARRPGPDELEPEVAFAAGTNRAVPLAAQRQQAYAAAASAVEARGHK